jgi:hypothetical protein
MVKSALNENIADSCKLQLNEAELSVLYFQASQTKRLSRFNLIWDVQDKILAAKTGKTKSLAMALGRQK